MSALSDLANDLLVISDMLALQSAQVRQIAEQLQQALLDSDQPPEMVYDEPLRERWVRS